MVNVGLSKNQKASYDRKKKLERVANTASFFTPANPAAAVQGFADFAGNGFKPPWQAKNGAKVIPINNMPVLLHKNERVLNAKQAKALLEAEKKGLLKLPKGDLVPQPTKPKLGVVRPLPIALK